MNREEIFKKGFSDFQKKQEEATRRKNVAQSGGFKREYEDVAYSALHYEWSVYRMIGAPIIDNKPFDQFSPRLLYVANIRGDDDKPFRCIFPPKAVQPDWILWRVLSKVLATSWVNGVATFNLAGVHDDILNVVNKNGKDKSKREYSYERGWQPQLLIPFNVIDRSDAPWHKEHKHTKILSRKVSESKRPNDKGETIYFYDVGVPETVYTGLMEIVEVAGDWEGYDVVIKKLSDNPWYNVKLGQVSDKMLSDVKSMVVEAPLTDEERSYTQYDLSKLFPITSYNKIEKKLGIALQRIDKNLGTGFFPELQELVAKEKADWSRNRQTEEPSQVVTQRPVSKSLETPVNRTLTGTRVEITSPDYLGMSLLGEADKDMIVGIKEDGSFEYKLKPGQQLYACSNNDCKFPAPETFPACPKCGAVFN